MLARRGTVELKTDRLLLRKIRPDDTEAVFYGCTGDEQAAKYTSWYAHRSVDDTRAFIGYLLSGDNETSYNWIIELGGRAVGTVNVCYSDEAAEVCGIAYALSPRMWGNGIVTEALRTVAAFLFDCVGYRKIIAGCDCENIGSVRVLEKIGMKQEARLRAQIRRKDGSFGDDLQFGLFADELLRQ